jgi:hypothetical protein
MVLYFPFPVVGGQFPTKFVDSGGFFIITGPVAFPFLDHRQFSVAIAPLTIGGSIGLFATGRHPSFQIPIPLFRSMVTSLVNPTPISETLVAWLPTHE